MRVRCRNVSRLVSHGDPVSQHRASKMLNGSGIRIFTGALLPRSVSIRLVYGRKFILVRHKSSTVGRGHLQTVARILDYMPHPEVANHPQAWCTGRAR